MDQKKKGSNDVAGGRGARADLTGEVTLKQTLRGVRMNHVSTWQRQYKEASRSDIFKEEQEVHVTRME